MPDGSRISLMEILCLAAALSSAGMGGMRKIMPDAMIFHITICADAQIVLIAAG